MNPLLVSSACTPLAAPYPRPLASPHFLSVPPQQGESGIGNLPKSTALLQIPSCQVLVSGHVLPFKIGANEQGCTAFAVWQGSLGRKGFLNVTWDSSNQLLLLANE